MVGAESNKMIYYNVSPLLQKPLKAKDFIQWVCVAYVEHVIKEYPDGSFYQVFSGGLETRPSSRHDSCGVERALQKVDNNPQAPGTDKLHCL